jgi:4-amino-4-deoxy-L-arabinose transferase-like glycosyltransferase
LLQKVKKPAIELSPLIIILIGATLVAFSLGTFQSYDTELEFEAASNIAKMGVPYVDAYGTIIDQPPLGFYTEALFFRIVGTSAAAGVTLMTLFGLGSIVIVYFLGKELYGRSTGLFAAALLGVSPWHLVLSRSFLLDAQCLFFSLLCLLVGVLAIRRTL